MTRRLIALMALMAALALVVSACGEDEDETAAAGSSGQSTQQEPAQTSADKDIVVLAQDTPQLSTLVKAVTAAELGGTLSGKGPFTVFAPTNAAFKALGQDTLNTLLEPANREQLASILTYHVVPQELMAADLRDGQKLETVNGQTLTVSVKGSDVRVGGARVVKPDVEASNGVVHVIDEVLQPSS